MNNPVVSVRIPISDFRKLQLLDQVYGQSVGKLIRDAVARHIKDLAATDEFRTRARKMQQHQTEILSQMLRQGMRAVPKK